MPERRTSRQEPVADLHLHSGFSDGSLSPAELVRAAARLGFAAIAVTDHDTVEGVPDALAAGESCGIEVIAGVEITCHVEATEIHLLGYFFNTGWQSPQLGCVLDHAKRVRAQRVSEVVDRLKALGIPLTVADVEACSTAGTLGRLHVAKALAERRLVKSVPEAFTRFLKRGRPAYVERYRMSASEAIGHVRRAGGLAVLAHPGLHRVDARIAEMVAQGLDGLEVWHSQHSAAATERYRQMVEELGLVATGGSDDHGTAAGESSFGRIRLPYAAVAQLRQRAHRDPVSCDP